MRTKIIQHTHNHHHLGTEPNKENSKNFQGDEEKENEETTEY